VKIVGETKFQLAYESAFELFKDIPFDIYATKLAFESQWLKWLAWAATWKQGTDVNHKPPSGADPFRANGGARVHRRDRTGKGQLPVQSCVVPARHRRLLDRGSRLDAVARRPRAPLGRGPAAHLPREPGHGRVRGVSRRLREPRHAGQPADAVPHRSADRVGRAAGVRQAELPVSVLRRSTTGGGLCGLDS